MRFNWKSKKFIGGLLTVILLGFGVANPSIISAAGTTAICAAVSCDA